MWSHAAVLGLLLAAPAVTAAEEADVRVEQPLLLPDPWADLRQDSGGPEAVLQWDGPATTYSEARGLREALEDACEDDDEERIAGAEGGWACEPVEDHYKASRGAYRRNLLYGLSDIDPVWESEFWGGQPPWQIHLVPGR
jgi:hypothetical protein